MKLARPLLIIVALTALVGFRSDDTFTLKQKPVKGDEATYSVSMNISMDGAEVSIEGKSHSKVTVVNDDGSYEQEETGLEAKQTVNGETTDIEKQEPKTVKYDKDGKRIKDAGEEEEDGSEMLQAIGDAFDYTPDHPVKVGETWTHDSDLGSSSMTLVGKEKLGEVECLKITMKGSLSKKDSSGEGEGTVFLRATDYQLEKAEMKLENVKLGEAPVMKKMELKTLHVAD